MPREVQPSSLVGAVFRLSMAIDRVGNAAATRIGLNQTDLICLTVLVDRGPTSPGSVAAELGLTPAAISAVAARLERRGLVRREIDPADRRRIVLTVEESGARAAFSAFDGLVEQLDGFFQRLSPERRQAFDETLEAYREILADFADSLVAGEQKPR